MDQSPIKQLIDEKLKNSEQTLVIIGVSGVVGAGKTYFCQNTLKNIYPQIKIIPMDGYHIYRKDLSEEGKLRRGAPFTFDFVRFKNDLIALRKNCKGSFPRFEHSEKDPVEDQIIITETDRLVAVEGLYLFLKEWNLNEIFDIKIKIDRPFDKLLVANRHLQSGIVESLEEGHERAELNDWVNSVYLLSNSDWDNAIMYQ